MGSKIKLKKKNGMVLPIAVMVLLGVLIGSVLLSKMNSSMSVSVVSLSRKNQSLNYNSAGVSYAINWLDKNKSNLNSDSYFPDVGSNTIVSYYANGYVYNSKAQPISSVVTKSTLFATDFNALTEMYKNKDKNSFGFINTIMIYRMCKFSDASPGDMVGSEENKCLKDNLMLTNAGSGTSSAGYGGYEYTVTPSSDKIIYVIFVATDTQGRASTTIPFTSPTITETMISM